MWTDNLHDAIWRRLEGSLGHNLSQVARSSVQLPENLQSAVEIRSAHRLLRFNPIFLSISLSLRLLQPICPFFVTVWKINEGERATSTPVPKISFRFLTIIPFPPAVRRSLYIPFTFRASVILAQSLIKFVRFISLDLAVRFTYPFSSFCNLPPR